MNNRPSIALAAVLLALTLLLPPLARAQTRQPAARRSAVVAGNRQEARSSRDRHVHLRPAWAMRDKNGEAGRLRNRRGETLAGRGLMGGVKAEFVAHQRDGIIPALLAGKFDVIVAGISITRPAI